MNQHGIHHTLDATYYLREGRPTYACASLLAAPLASPSHPVIFSSKAKYKSHLLCFSDIFLFSFSVSVFISGDTKGSMNKKGNFQVILLLHRKW